LPPAEAAEVEAVRDEPLVAAVLDKFPDAEIVDVRPRDDARGAAMSEIAALRQLVDDLAARVAAIENGLIVENAELRSQGFTATRRRCSR
jgi:hypothetical protein